MRSLVCGFPLWPGPLNGATYVLYRRAASICQASNRTCACLQCPALIPTPPRASGITTSRWDRIVMVSTTQGLLAPFFLFSFFLISLNLSSPFFSRSLLLIVVTQISGVTQQALLPPPLPTMVRLLRFYSVLLGANHNNLFRRGRG